MKEGRSLFTFSTTIGGKTAVSYVQCMWCVSYVQCMWCVS